MSISELDKATEIKNESATSVCSIKQENSTHANDMELVTKETVLPGSLTIAKSNELTCIDMENSKEPHADINDQMESGELVNLSELTAHVISQRAARRKLTIKGLYEYMLGYGKQAQLRREVGYREQRPLQPEQAVWMQYGPTQIQGPLQGPFQGPLQGPLQGPPQGPFQGPLHIPPQRPLYDKGPGYPSGPQFTQAQGYPQQGQGYYPPPQGQGYYPPPQGQGYYPPPQGQGYYPPPQGQGYYQGGGGGGGGAHTYPPLRGQYGYPTGEPMVYEPESRNGFVRLVMSIVLLMLLITAILVAYVLLTDNLRLWFRAARWEVLLPSLFLILGANYGMICSPCGRVCPGSCICLAMTVMGMSLMACKITSHYRTPIILYAVIATAAVVMVCVLLAFSKFDFTSYFLYIIGISVAFSVIVMIIFLTSILTGTMLKPLFIIILLVGTIIQVVILSMELQMVLGGRAIQISEQDYALAAYLIYTSILDIFLKMVQLMGLVDNG